MSSSDRVLVCLLLLGLLGPACLPADSADPLPQRLSPGWGLNTAPVEGTIEGERFLPLAVQHVGGEEPVTMDEHFEAFLGDVALEDVVRRDEHALGVRIPEGLAPGWYTLAVVGPLGRRVELPHAYYATERRLASLEPRATWEQQRLRVGQPIRLSLAVHNPGTTAALGVTARLRLEDAPGVELRSAPDPEDIAPGASTTLHWELDALQAGAPRFSLELQGREELTALELEAPPVALEPLEIREPVKATTTVLTSPAVINVGQGLRVTLHVTNDGTEDLRAVTPGEPQLEGLQASRMSGPEPARLDLPAGRDGDFVWTYAPTSAGTGIFQVGLTAIDAFSGAGVGLPAARSAGALVQRPGALSARILGVPATISQGQQFDVSLEVTNTGDSLVRGVQLQAASISGAGSVTLISGPVPASLDVAGGGTAIFQARLIGNNRGTCVLRSGAGGRDATDGSLVSAPPTDTSLLIR